jgi:hypothetical protein
VNTLDYGKIRLYTLLYIAVFVKVRPFYGMGFDVYGRGSLPYTTRRSHGRNTVPTKRAIYGQYTAVNIAFTAVHARVNGRLRLFTFVVLIDSGSEKNEEMVLYKRTS